MRLDLTGHSALVTGARGGIGRAIAQAIASSGANVVLHSHIADAEAAAAVEACRACGVRASLVVADFLHGQPDAVAESLYAAAIAAEPAIDLLVNNAGGCLHPAPFIDVTPEQFDQTYRLNVTCAYFLTQRLVRRWIGSQVRGRVVLTGSINGVLAEVSSSLYDSCKGAVGMLVKSLGVELAGKGIRVNGIAPGLVRTPFTNWLSQRPADEAWMRLHTPNGVIPGPESCAGSAVFLLSDAAEHVCGHMLMVDGGIGAWQQPPTPPGFAAGSGNE